MPTVRMERLIFPCRTVTVLILGCMLTMWRQTAQILKPIRGVRLKVRMELRGHPGRQVQMVRRLIYILLMQIVRMERQDFQCRIVPISCILGSIRTSQRRTVQILRNTPGQRSRVIRGLRGYRDRKVRMENSTIHG